jgi:2-keto-4-pentenoate hydratase/2-oxohepta-3-ene-1,7-dioic acid hydratase in catechol pathway
VIGSTCKRVQPSDSMKHVGGYVLALDMTARDFQVSQLSYYNKYY